MTIRTAWHQSGKVKPFSRSTRSGALAAALFWLCAGACAGEGMRSDPSSTETGGSAGAETGGAGGGGGPSGGKSGGGTGGAAPADAGSSAQPDLRSTPEPTPTDAQARSDTGDMPDLGQAPMGARPSPACAGTAVMPGPNGNQTIMANGKSRMFIIRMPTGYDGKKATPVWFLMHGAGGGAQSFEGGFGGTLSKMAADKAVRIFPQAYGGNTWSRDENDDVLFMDAIVKWLDEKICYDQGAVFSSGQSSGAYFSHRFACDRGNIVRAVATNSGGERKERPMDCKIGVSSWTDTGLGDNPGHVAGTRQASQVWAKLAGCSMETAPTEPPQCKAYKGCKPGYAVHHCEHSGGHAPPGFAAGAMYQFLFGGKYLGGN